MTEQDIYDIYHNIVFQFFASKERSETLLEKELYDLNKLAENHDIKVIFSTEHIFGKTISSEDSNYEDSSDF